MGLSLPHGRLSTTCATSILINDRKYIFIFPKMNSAWQGLHSHFNSLECSLFLSTFLCIMASSPVAAVYRVHTFSGTRPPNNTTRQAQYWSQGISWLIWCTVFSVLDLCLGMVWISFGRSTNPTQFGFCAIWSYGDAMTWTHVLHNWPLCVGNPPVTGGFPAQRASNAEFWCFLCCYPNKLLNKQ